MRTDVLVAFRQQRLELIVLVVGGLVVAAAVFAAATLFDDALLNLQSCHETLTAPDPSGKECELESTVTFLLGGTIFVGTPAGITLALVAAVLLGGPLIAGEVERRTAALVWSLNASRRRWLLRRSLPVIAALVTTVTAIAFAGDHGLRAALLVAELGFGQYDAIAPLVVARVLLLFTIAALVGTIAGRTLPAVVIAALLAVGIAAGLAFGRDQLMRAEAVPIPQSAVAVGSPAYDYGFRDESSGMILTWGEAYERFPEFFEAGFGAPPGLTEVVWTVPPERLASYIVREVIALGALGIVVVAATFYIVERRRL